ncbi:MULTISPECIES: CBS domain-containing protein [Lentisalinibacter]|uniref:CBS domain-containing protein n=1 Tax=Lentisalinibacter TaxID=3382081 RepID=UPI003870BB79
METMKVQDYMTRNVLTLRPDMEILRALAIFVDNDVAGAPVTDRSGRLVGILTEGDFMKVALHGAYHGEPGGRVEEYMHRNVETVRPRDSIMSLAEHFLESPYRRYPVVDRSGRLIGIIAWRDVLRALKNQMGQY